MAKAARPTRKTRPERPARPAPKKRDLSTEEKIMQAARKLFTKKGFAAIRTRDIAKEAGINLALLNYYFRSKEKLFDIVMMDNFRQFIKGISVNLADEKATIPEKVQQLATAYIDFLTLNPDLPLFVLNELRGNPSGLAEKLIAELGPSRSYMLNQLQEAAKEGKMPPINPFHIVANLVGLTVFPFVARPLLQKVTGANDQQFLAFMQERKKLVPIWVNAILHAK